jgi:P-type Ca2+ transporter type 2C
MTANWYRLSIDETLTLLGSRKEGLSTPEVEERLEKYGPNVLASGRKKRIGDMILSQFADIMILILIAASVLSVFIGDITDTIAILLIVIVNALIGFFQEYRAEKAMNALKRLAVPRAAVWRDKTIHHLPGTVLVPGEVVLLEAGNLVPTDLRLLESVNLKTDESTLTGESSAVYKNTTPLDTEYLPTGDLSNMAFRGTFITYGRGTGVVVATGMQTELGRIAGMLQGATTQTPLQRRVATYGSKLSLIVIFLCILFFITGWIRGENILKMMLTSIIFPKVVGRELNVSTWSILVSMIAGGILRGVSGMILFMPFVAILKIISDDVEDWKPLNILISRRHKS